MPLGPVQPRIRLPENWARAMVVAALCGVTVVAVIAAGSDRSKRHDSGSQPSEAHRPGAFHRWRCPHSRQHMYPHIERARIFPDPEPISSTQRPAVNGWVAGGHRQVTWVWAGGSENTGRFVISREWPCRPGNASYGNAHVEVPGAGRLKITKAPLGRKVAVWAQHHGVLRHEPAWHPGSPPPEGRHGRAGAVSWWPRGALMSLSARKAPSNRRPGSGGDGLAVVLEVDHRRVAVAEPQQLIVRS